MSHYCHTSIIACEDFRLHQRQDGRNCIAEFIKTIAVDADLITRAGGIQDLIRPKETGFEKSLLRDLGVSVNLHDAKEICLINHADCGAYSDFNFQNKEAEFEQHKKDLLAAKEIIEKEFPDRVVKIYFADLKDGKFEIREI
jgi:carbonic anhydrase